MGRSVTSSSNLKQLRLVCKMMWSCHSHSYRWGKIARLTRALEVSLLAWAWMTHIAKAQDLSGAVSGTISFLDAGLTTLGHIAAFVNCFQRGRLDVEMASRDFLLCLTEEKLVEVSSSPSVSALSTTDDVDVAQAVLLTTSMSGSVRSSFMKHIAACYDVHSLVVSCLPLRKVALTIEECICREQCYCLCAWSTPEIMRKLALRLPGNIKQVSPELYLLPSYNCFDAGCHGCSHDMLYFGGGQGLRNGDPDTTNAVGALCVSMHIAATKDPLCFVVPCHSAVDDHWSQLLLRILRTKDEAGRDLQIEAAEALDLYTKGQKPVGPTTWRPGKFSFMFPRIMEMVLNAVLTGWFRVDGFSSALVCRRTVRDYVVNSIGNGLHASVFLSDVVVTARISYVHICQSLKFRPPLQSLRSAAWMGATVNALCTIWWITGVSLHRGLGNWSSTYTRPPTLFKLYALMASVGGALAMDGAHSYLNRMRWKEFPLLWAAMALEMLLLVAMSSILGIFGPGVFGTWIYGVIQAMVWMKWVVGSLLLGSDVITPIFRQESGTLVYSSAFLLAAILAAVGGNWK